MGVILVVGRVQLLSLRGLGIETHRYVTVIRSCHQTFVILLTLCTSLYLTNDKKFFAHCPFSSNSKNGSPDFMLAPNLSPTSRATHILPWKLIRQVLHLRHLYRLILFIRGWLSGTNEVRLGRGRCVKCTCST
jgi:hypothetical protein